MRISCPKCQKNIIISEDKLPKDKDKAMVKCPGCKQILVFNIPQVSKTPVVNEERTIIENVAGGQNHDTAKLVKSSTLEEFTLKPGFTIIGRKADISLENDPYVSRKNCQIEVKKAGSKTVYILTDDGSFSDSGVPSANGTFHNGIRLSKFDKIFLVNKDVIRLGRTELIFISEE